MSKAIEIIAMNGQHNAYEDGELIATIHQELPNRANGRLSEWNVCRMDGSVAWVGSFEAACEDVRSPGQTIPESRTNSPRA
ncbi:MAG: hypothetical protein EPN79_10720 [Burkholderiaceae bacterium]|nr:MAG: hypothetical protein EPN79_10720 [Burkholderiaceae bacterium]TBR76840.1 MAG: hypothetical protein EPN64_06355 [Burkholderiaceae bacterium]